MKLQVAGSTLVNVQVPVLAGLIITAEVGIFLLLACFSSPGGHIFKSFETTKSNSLFYNPNRKCHFSCLLLTLPDMLFICLDQTKSRHTTFLLDK